MGKNEIGERLPLRIGGGKGQLLKKRKQSEH